MTKVWLMCKGIIKEPTPMLPYKIFDSLPDLDDTWQKRKVRLQGFGNSKQEVYYKEDETFRYSLVEWVVQKGEKL